MKRRGFTISEALVMLTIIGIIIAVMLPEIMGRIKDSQLSALKGTLESIQTGLKNFHTDVTRYPFALQYLALSPAGKVDICRVSVMGSVLTNNWRGPYVSLKHTYSGSGTDTLGVAVGDWMLRNALARTPATAATVTSTGRLLIEIVPITLTDATALNTLVDGPTVPPLSSGADTSGTIRWTSVSGGNAISTTWGFVIAGC